MPKRIEKGMTVFVTLNPKAHKTKQRSIRGRVEQVLEKGDTEFFRVSYDTSWGTSSGWYLREHIS